MDITDWYQHEGPMHFTAHPPFIPHAHTPTVRKYPAFFQNVIITTAIESNMFRDKGLFVASLRIWKTRFESIIRNNIFRIPLFVYFTPDVNSYYSSCIHTTPTILRSSSFFQVYTIIISLHLFSLCIYVHPVAPLSKPNRRLPVSPVTN